MCDDWSCASCIYSNKENEQLFCDRDYNEDDVAVSPSDKCVLWKRKGGEKND